MRGRIGGMGDAKRKDLVRSLAAIDQLLAAAEALAGTSEGEDRERAQAILIEFEETRRKVEARLREK
jgi:hypothetical protein